jgi:hypothetical protein
VVILNDTSPIKSATASYSTISEIGRSGCKTKGASSDRVVTLPGSGGQAGKEPITS